MNKNINQTKTNLEALETMLQTIKLSKANRALLNNKIAELQSNLTELQKEVQPIKQTQSTEPVKSTKVYPYKPTLKFIPKDKNKLINNCCFPIPLENPAYIYRSTLDATYDESTIDTREPEYLISYQPLSKLKGSIFETFIVKDNMTVRTFMSNLYKQFDKVNVPNMYALYVHTVNRFIESVHTHTTKL